MENRMKQGSKYKILYLGAPGKSAYQAFRERTRLMRHIIMVLLLALAVIPKASPAMDRFDIVTTAEMKEMLQDRFMGRTDFALANAVDEILFRFEAIPGSINVPLSKFDETVHRLGTEKDRDSIFIKDNQGKYTYVNKALENLLGMQASDVYGKNDLEVFGKEAADIFHKADVHVLFPATQEARAGEKEGVPDQNFKDDKPHILLVDDEEYLVEAITEQLQSLGYRVTGASNPKDAIKKFKKNPDGFQLVVTDNVMPRLSGRTMADEIKDI